MVRVKNYKPTSNFVKVNAEKTVYRLTLFTLFFTLYLNLHHCWFSLAIFVN